MIPKVSVIVPIYNSEKYLRECLDSIANQTISDIQVLMIDDGSTDSSAVICKEYVDKYPGFEYYYKENGGTASARNVGLQNAKGEYLGFVDSDDYIEPKMLYVMYQNAISSHCDILHCVMYGLHDNVDVEPGTYIGDEIKEYIFPKLLPHINNEGTFRALDYSICSKLIRRKFITDNSIVMYEKSRYIEDLAFAFECTINANSYIIIDEGKLYYYRKVKDSKSRSYAPNMWNELSPLLSYVKEIAINYEKYDFRSMIEYSLFYYCYSAVKNETKNPNKKQAINNISTIINDPICVFSVEAIVSDHMNSEFAACYQYISTRDAKRIYQFLKRIGFIKKHIAPITNKLFRNKTISNIYRLVRGK